MTFPVPYGGITITVVRPTYDRFNDATWNDHHDIENCIEYPASTSEGDAKTAVRDVRTLVLPSHSDLLPIDRVVLWERVAPAKPTGELRKASTYSVIGLPKDWVHHMTGWAPGMTAEIVKVT